MKKYILFISLVTNCIFHLSCSRQAGENDYALIKTDDVIRYRLDPNTKSSFMAMMTYQDKKGTEYLTFQNPINNDLYFYDLNTQDYRFKISPKEDGVNGVGFILGFYVHNLDSIFLTTRSIKEISLINKDAKVIDKFNYEKTIDGIHLQRGFSITTCYTPLQIVDDKLYLVTGCTRWQEENPVSISINLKNKEVHALPFNYPKLPQTTNKNKRAGSEELMSRCFNGKEFIYSFYFDEAIYIASLDHKQIRKVNIKSRYIDRIEYIDDYGRMGPEKIVELANYGNLLYDPYREVYYRLAYPKTELEKGVNGIELMKYGRKKFSIIILNKDFEIIGETLFPDYTYNPQVLYIREDGLYISDSHYLNPAFSDDILSFKRFVLSKGL